MSVNGPGATYGRSAVTAAIVLAACSLFSPSGRAQNPTTPATLAALVEYPNFYVDRTVIVRGQLRATPGRTSLEDADGHRVVVAWKPQEKPDGTVDATGTLWDVGRMKQDDPRLAGWDTSAIVGTSGQEWPRPGELFVLSVTRFVPADPNRVGLTPGARDSIRAIILEGSAAAGRRVTVVGQFRGRNLFGDVPKAPGTSRWDFVVRSGDAAIWVTGLQPRGKGFDFDPDKRIDSNHWLEVTGTVRENRGLMSIAAASLALAQPPTDTATTEASQPKPVAPAAPPEILFSIPAEGETDVSATPTVRIQLSRTVDRASLANRIRASYVGPAPGQQTFIPSSADLEERNDAPGGAVAVLRIRFDQPLERWRTVRIELLDGIKSADGQVLKPWTLTFTVGGS